MICGTKAIKMTVVAAAISWSLILPARSQGLNSF